MKISLKQIKEYDAKYLNIWFPIEDDDERENVPGQSNDYIHWMIDLGQKQILNYSYNNELFLYEKIRDEFSCRLFDRNGDMILELIDEYVPSGIGEYGDYINMKISPDGYLLNCNLKRAVDDIAMTWEHIQYGNNER